MDAKEKHIYQMKTLFVKRRLLNGDAIKSWAEDQDFPNMLPECDLHVTIAHSSDPVDWTKFEEQNRNLKIIGGTRSIDQFGDAVVLCFATNRLQERWQEFRDEGASWDFDSYKPHITITYEAIPADVEPYRGELILGPEIFSEVEENWADNVIEDDL